jgi:hypothetical protein
MARMTSDQIGSLAELLAATALSRPTGHPFHRPLFRTTHLGEKYPAVDFLVDILGPDNQSQGFCFAQVKGTGTAKSGGRLALDVPLDRFNQLVRLAAPSYLIGVDIRTEESFIVSAYRPRRTRVSSITRAFPLDTDSGKVNLYREVLGFWTAHRRFRVRTGFKDV